MSRYFQFVMVLVYVLLTICAFEVVLMTSGLHTSIVSRWWTIVGWVALCFGSAYIRAGVYTIIRFRRPIREEEERLAPAIAALQEKTGNKRRIAIRIDPSPELNASAMGYHTVTITKALLDRLSPNELRGVLAHELGHLLTGDTTAAAAFSTAGLLPQLVFRIVGMIVWLVRQTLTGFSILTSVAILLVLGYFLHRVHLLDAVIPVILFVVFFAILDGVFRFFSLMLSRMAEYRQDAFASQLGYGVALRSVLQMLAAGSAPVVNRYYIVMHSTHPVVYNRIRRLEKLEGK